MKTSVPSFLLAALLVPALSSRAAQVAFTEVMYHPKGSEPEFIEVWNFSRTALDMAKWEFTNGVSFTFPDFNDADPQAHFLQGNEVILLSAATPEATRAAWPTIPASVRIFGPWTGSLANSGETVTLTNKNGVDMCTLSYKDSGHWSPAADGAGHSLVLINENRERDNWRNWKASPKAGGSPGLLDTGAEQTLTVVELGDTWKYNDRNENLGTAWTDPAFSDADWASGAGLFGYESPGAVIVAPGLNTEVTRSTTADPPPEGYSTNLITTYFRKSFTWDGSTTGASFSIDHVLDDGVAYYLNGVELGRVALPAGADWKTLATANPPDAVEATNALSGSIPATALRAGVNVLSAEVHNASGGSSDLMWGMRLKITAPPGDSASALSGLRISEVHYNNSSGTVDWVEFANTSAASVTLSGLTLATRDDPAATVPLSGTLAAGTYVSVSTDFPAGANGVTLFLANASGNILSTAEVPRRIGKPSAQRYPLASDNWFTSTTSTQDADNNPAGREEDVVINELMIDPVSGSVRAKYVELYNRGAVTVNLSGWRFTEGVDFTFPAGTSIAPGGYVVVAADAAWLNSHYPGLNAIGDWSGNLSSNGELLRLVDADNNPADSVDYLAGGDWPDLAAGLGSSLELANPALDNSQASAWRDSDESTKAAWTPISTTGTYRQLNSLGAATDYKEIHYRLVGDGHIALRNITLRKDNTGSNLLNNVTTQSPNGSSATGWLAQGTHWATFVDPSGELQLIADGHGDNRANRAELDATALTVNNSYTWSWEARWVSGKPRLIAETWDHSLGGTWEVPVPENLGTPGAANSRHQALPPPQIDGLIHSPAVPTSTDDVTVTARVSSVSPLTAVTLRHRADSAAGTGVYASQPMVDDGTNGDAIAHDGIYTAVVTAYKVNKRIAQFYVEATATNGEARSMPKQGAEQPAMWICDNQVVQKTLRSQRFIISAYWLRALSTGTGQSSTFGFDFPRLSNHYFPAVFIHNEKDVYYGAGIRKNGSPWTRTDGAELDRGRWKLPGDRRFREHDTFTFDNDPTQGRMHHNRIIRYWLYLMGHPVGENEFVYTMRNGDNAVVREDTEPNGTDLLNRNWKDGSRGQLMRMDDEWWFQDNWNRNNRDADWGYKGTDEPIRYHTEWMSRSNEADYDYSALTGMIRTIGTNSFNQEQIERIMDPRLTLMMAAVRGYAGDWDSFTLNRGKNGFMYRKPDDGRWIFMHWDSDLAFQGTGEVVVGTHAGVRNYIDKPYNRRWLNYYLTEIVNKYAKGSTRMTAWFDAEEASSTAYAISRGTYTNWFTGREARIKSEINQSTSGGNSGALTAPLALTSPPASTTSDALTLVGTAPSTAFTLTVDGHPEATFSWLTQTRWSLAGLTLPAGPNLLTIRSWDQDGTDLGTVSAPITRTGNASPLARLDISPKSQNASVGELVELDASASTDPEATALTYLWSVSPAAGVTLGGATSPTTTAVFSAPGIFTVSLTVTDADGQAATLTRDIHVTGSADFHSFSAPQLGAAFTLQHLAPRGNSRPDAWYSLEEKANRLFLHLTEQKALPLTDGASLSPWAALPLPATTDWALQTDLTLESRRTGTFFTGLRVELTEAGAPRQYAFGYENGTGMTVKRSISGGTFTNLATQTAIGYQTLLRIRRTGGQLFFESSPDAVAWTTVHTASLSAPATGVKGGLFVSTGAAAQSLSVSFDYLELSNPGSASSLLTDLRITEIMYNPAGAGGVEFLELQNTGSQILDLVGCRFVEGNPFSEFVFGPGTLAPGEFILLTNDTAAFRALYGAGPRLAGQWAAGSLSNSGERVLLVDPVGNAILDFSWGTSAPWPEAADGTGVSLEIVNPAGFYTDPANWIAGREQGGTPGAPGSGPDTDGDGFPDSWELITGTDPANPASFLRVTATPAAGGSITLTWPGLAGRTWKVQAGSDLTSWQTLATLPGTTATMSWTDPAPAPGKRFYRLHVTQP